VRNHLHFKDRFGNMAKAEVFPVGDFIKEEMEARGWGLGDLINRMGGDILVNALTLDLIVNVHDRDILLGEVTARELGKAFGTSEEYWLGLDRAWREHGKA